MSKQLNQLLLDNRDSSIRLPRQKLKICLGLILKEFAPDRRLEVVFIDGVSMQQINKKWHNSNSQTDVLAFAYEDDDLLGEIFVCTDTARRESKKRQMTLSSELVLYTVHGALHLVGFDDHTLSEQKKMRCKEVEVLSHVNLMTDRLEDQT